MYDTVSRFLKISLYSSLYRLPYNTMLLSVYIDLTCFFQTLDWGKHYVISMMSWTFLWECYNTSFCGIKFGVYLISFNVIGLYSKCLKCGQRYPNFRQYTKLSEICTKSSDYRHILIKRVSIPNILFRFQTISEIWTNWKPTVFVSEFRICTYDFRVGIHQALPSYNGCLKYRR